MKRKKLNILDLIKQMTVGVGFLSPKITVEVVYYGTKLLENDRKELERIKVRLIYGSTKQTKRKIVAQFASTGRK